MQGIQLTGGILARYVGGQIEIQNSEENYILRGQIDHLVIEGDMLAIHLIWFASGDGGVPPYGWTEDPRTSYSLHILSASDLGIDRIGMRTSIIGEFAVLFPPYGSKLNRTKVKRKIPT